MEDSDFLPLRPRNSLSLLILETIILFIHYNQSIYYLVQRLGLYCVLCFRCLTDNVALHLQKFY